METCGAPVGVERHDVGHGTGRDEARGSARSGPSCRHRLRSPADMRVSRGSTTGAGALPSGPWARGRGAAGEGPCRAPCPGASPRARGLARSATDSLKAFAAAGVRLPTQAASICLTRSVSAVRRAFSNLECLATIRPFVAPILRRACPGSVAVVAYPWAVGLYRLDDPGDLIAPSLVSRVRRLGRFGVRGDDGAGRSWRARVASSPGSRRTACSTTGPAGRRWTSWTAG